MAVRGRGRNIAPHVAGLLLAVLVGLLQFMAIPALDRPGLQLFDMWQRAAPRAYAPVPVRVVDIDEESIERLGQWPWPRTVLARLNDRLAAAGARVIAYDIVFSEPDRTSPAMIARQLPQDPAARELATRLAALEDNDRVFARSIAASPVVLGHFLVAERRGRPIEPTTGIALAGGLPTAAVASYGGALQSLPMLQDAARGSGSLTLPRDADGIVRRVPLVAIANRQLIPSLPLDALRVAMGDGPVIARTSASPRGSVVTGLRVGQIDVPVSEDGRIWLHHTGHVPQRTVPAWRLLQGDRLPPDLARDLDGAIVFVGASATGLRDLVATALDDREPGVVQHAKAAEQMLLGHHLVRPDWARGLELALVLLLGGGLALLAPRLGALAGFAVGAAIIALLIAGSWLTYLQLRYLLDPGFPVAAVALVYSAQTVLVFYREEQERAYIHRAFDRYLSPELVRQIAANPAKLELGGEERDMTVLMADIRGFSSISEQLTPQQLITFLIGFLTPMSDILLAHRATLDKYIGDAILAFWNAPLDDPDHHRNAARAALAMTAALAELNRSMPQTPGQIWPADVKIGIGLNSGLCCVGNMGSRQKLAYSLIGDTVNLAARLEGQTKQYGVPILIGEETARHLSGFALVELDRLRVVGRDRPVTVFALLGDEVRASAPAFTALQDAQAAMLDSLRQRDFARAARRLEATAAALEGAGLGRVLHLYRQRLASLQETPPPAEWDGVFNAESK